MKRIVIALTFALCFAAALCACSPELPELIAISAVEPTCYNNGNIAYWESTTTGKFYFDENGEREITDLKEVEIPAAHKLVEVAEIESNCQQSGRRAYWHCSGCSLNFTDETATTAIEDLSELLVEATMHGPDSSNKCAYCGEDMSTSELMFSLSEDGTGYVLEGLLGASGVIYIPELHEGKKVIGIAAAAFKEEFAITGIYMPDSIKTVGAEAFSGCVELTTVRLSAALESIGEKAFYGCSDLKNIRVGKNSVRYSAEKGCIIDKTAKTVIFGGETAVIPDHIEHIAPYAFAKSLIAAVVIPEKIKTIGDGAFAGCRFLQRADIHGAKKFGNAVFAGASDELTIYFHGTEAEWLASEKGENNPELDKVQFVTE